jgi:hypothetical protein
VAVGFGMDLLFKKDMVPLTQPVHKFGWQSVWRF